MTRWPQVRLGEVLELRREPLEVGPADMYTSIGIKSFGKGLFRYPPIAGAELSKIRYFRFPGNALIASNIQAWEGAFAVSTVRDSKECIASNRFLPYVPRDRKAVDPEFVRLFLLSDPGWAEVRGASPGTAVRNKTLSRDLFEAIKIPLPPLDEQRRIAAHLKHASQLSVGLARTGTAGMAGAIDAAIEDYLASLSAQGWRSAPMASVADVNPRRARLADEDVVDFVPMAAVDDVTGSIQRAERRTAAEVAKGHTQFLPGDVIFARITPCMQNGKAARFRPSDEVAAGYGSTEFHVLRPHAVTDEWLHHWVRRARFRQDAMHSFTGTAGQQRVPASYLEAAEILIAPTTEAEHVASGRLQELATLGLALGRRRAQRDLLLRGLGPAMLNKVFSGRV